MILLKTLSLWLIIITSPGTTIGDITIRQPINHSGAWLNPGNPYEYGAAILVVADDVTIERVRIDGGVIGLAAIGVKNLTVRDSLFTDQSAWGIYLLNVEGAHIENNEITNAIRACPQSPDGCESAGIIGLGVMHSILERNRCTYSGDCFYFNGEIAPSNGNRLVENLCVAAPHNCFEITFSHGNVLERNITRREPEGRECLYPLWVGGSDIVVRDNNFSCIKGLQRSIDEARDSTSVPTIIR